MKILVINGPNINMLGIREPEIYGTETYEDLIDYINDSAKELGIEVDCFQSNHEGDIVDAIQGAIDIESGTGLGKKYGMEVVVYRYDGIIINPAAYTHTSVAIGDALKAVGVPAVEVHLSDVNKREAYRQISFVSEACIQTIAGHGFAGYKEALATMAEQA